MCNTFPTSSASSAILHHMCQCTGYLINQLPDTSQIGYFVSTWTKHNLHFCIELLTWDFLPDLDFHINDSDIPSRWLLLENESNQNYIWAIAVSFKIAKLNVDLNKCITCHFIHHASAVLGSFICSLVLLCSSHLYGSQLKEYKSPTEAIIR